ncbi:unnamed protein product [Symbiodinium sp. CCMP2592]|nr:unnamed protein product [Symbiodinium sp. CCMP2592]
MLLLKQNNHILRVTFSAASQEDFANGTLSFTPDGGLSLNKPLDFSVGVENISMFSSVKHAEAKLRCEVHSKSTVVDEKADEATAASAFKICILLSASASTEKFPEDEVGVVNLQHYMSKNTKAHSRPSLPSESWSLVVFPSELETTAVHHFLTHGVAPSAVVLDLQVKQEVMMPAPGVGVDVRCIPEKASLAGHWLFTGSDAKTVLGHIRKFVIKAVVGKSDLVAVDSPYTDVLQSLKDRADKRQALKRRRIEELKQLVREMDGPETEGTEAPLPPADSQSA